MHIYVQSDDIIRIRIFQHLFRHRRTNFYSTSFRSQSLIRPSELKLLLLIIVWLDSILLLRLYRYRCRVIMPFDAENDARELR